MTLSSLAFNILMGMSGGIIGAYVVAKDPFFMMSGALAGIISTASGLDVYDPSLAMVMGFAGGALLKPCYDMLERFGIDDAVGAVTVHGTIGLFGLIMFGVWGAGLPAIQGEGVATVSLIGQIVGAVVFFLLGVCPRLCGQFHSQCDGNAAGQRRGRACRAGRHQSANAGLSGRDHPLRHTCGITVRTRRYRHGL